MLAASFKTHLVTEQPVSSSSAHTGAVLAHVAVSAPTPEALSLISRNAPWMLTARLWGAWLVHCGGAQAPGPGGAQAAGPGQALLPPGGHGSRGHRPGRAVRARGAADRRASHFGEGTVTPGQAGLQNFCKGLIFSAYPPAWILHRAGVVG